MNLVEWINHYGEEKIPEKLMRYYANSGSGFDSPITIDWKNTSKKQLTIKGSYHIMSDNGYYVGWVHYKVVFIATLSGVAIKVTGVRNAYLRDYIGDTIKHHFLDLEIPRERLMEIE